MKIVKKILKEEGGQALVPVALMMVVLIGFAAIAVDIGMVTWQKSNLQNADDAAARCLPLLPWTSRMELPSLKERSPLLNRKLVISMSKKSPCTFSVFPVMS